ncbi:hypothetical protein B0H13DRAFT_1898144 [Mycena leptocephala]|nr:hypothetical protein B0H13DRAFT_1898144 [Mycena leptocephala]
MLADLEADRARIADLESQISALRKEKNLAQERLDSYKYPVLTLPNEIVSEIFIHFLPTYHRFPPLTGLFSPTLLTHICRTWREIALRTPALWSAISAYGDVPSEQTVRTFDTWLKRSRSRPLSVQIVDLTDSDVAGILAAVVPHCARWEYLDLYLPPSHLPIIEGPMPLLRHLDLEFREYPATDVLAFREAPLLRTAVLQNAASSSVILPWAQLTSLKTLALNGPGRLVTDLLGTFIVPALRSLKTREEILGASPIELLTGFISKSGCKLDKVHIAGARLLPPDSYRQAFPSIRKFSFSD